MDQYNISQLPGRQQTAQHFHSSMQEPNLSNVEAQLEVTRQRNRDMARQYFQSKLGSQFAYDQYLVRNSLQGLIHPSSTELDFKTKLDKKAYQIQLAEQQKILRAKEQSLGLNQSARRSNQVSRSNPWTEDKAKVQIQKEQKTQKEQETPFQNMPSTLKNDSQYLSEFKKYLINKQSAGKQAENQSKHVENTSVEIPNKPKASYEEDLVKKIFKDILGHSNIKQSTIEKLSLIEYLASNKRILDVLGFTKQNLANKLLNGPEMEASDSIDFNDCLILVYGQLGKQQEVRSVMARKQVKDLPQGCMLPIQTLKKFEALFKQNDKHSDLIIKRIGFIGRLAMDPEIKKQLNVPAVYEPQLQRSVSLRRVFQRIEIETLLGSEEQQKANEFISWNQFIRYFESGHRERTKYDLINLVESLKHEDKFGLSQFPDQVATIVQDVFKKLDKGEQFFSTLEVIQQIRLHPDFQLEKYTLVRPANEEIRLPSETLDQVLKRVKDYGLKHVNVKQFLEYFSQRGKPIEEFEQLKSVDIIKANASVKVSFASKQLLEENRQTPEGYDSDPQTYSNVHPKAKMGIKSQKNFNKLNETMQSAQEAPLKLDGIGKITVPTPFKFEEREKMREAQKSTVSKIEPSEQSLTFKAKPVPKNVSTVGIYSKMIAEDKQRVEDRRKNQMLMTLAMEQPFSFENRKIEKKTKEERQKFVFKAKPIPWYCSVDLLKRKEEENIARNEKIAKLAQQKLEMARLPPRMQKDFLAREAKKMLEGQQLKGKGKSVVRIKDPPDFTRLHKEFEQELEGRRKQNKTTEVQEFHFSNPKVWAKSAVPAQESKIKTTTSIPPQHQVDIMANSTAKFTQQVEMRRKELEQKRKKQEQKQQEDQKRNKVDPALKQKVCEAVPKHQQKQKEAIQKRREENQKQEQKFREWKQECVTKGRKQPLLVQRISKRDEQLQKMKKLQEISKTLKGNGIVGKDHDKYFKKDELNLLRDYQILKVKM